MALSLLDSVRLCSSGFKFAVFRFFMFLMKYQISKSLWVNTLTPANCDLWLPSEAATDGVGCWRLLWRLVAHCWRQMIINTSSTYTSMVFSPRPCDWRLVRVSLTGWLAANILMRQQTSGLETTSQRQERQPCYLFSKMLSSSTYVLHLRKTFLKFPWPSSIEIKAMFHPKYCCRQIIIIKAWNNANVPDRCQVSGWWVM